MPCDSSHMNPTHVERNSATVIRHLREVGLTDRRENAYGDVRRLSEDTAALCDWCKTHDVTAQSLELQIWWRDHQRADREKEYAEVLRAEGERIRRRAIAKLTDDECKALGLTRKGIR